MKNVKINNEIYNHILHKIYCINNDNKEEVLPYDIKYYHTALLLIEAINNATSYNTSYFKIAFCNNIMMPLNKRKYPNIDFQEEAIITINNLLYNREDFSNNYMISDLGLNDVLINIEQRGLTIRDVMYHLAIKLSNIYCRDNPNGFRCKLDYCQL